MKKRLFLCFFCLALLFLCSCQNQSYGILKYQDKKISAECTLNGEYKILIEKDGDKRRISFISPSALTHVSFEINGESVVGRAGELEISLENEDVRGIFALSSIFSLGEEYLSAAVSEGERAYLEFSTEYGIYRLTLGKNDLPSTVQIYSEDYRYEVSIDAITIF